MDHMAAESGEGRAGTVSHTVAEGGGPCSSCRTTWWQGGRPHGSKQWQGWAGHTQAAQAAAARPRGGEGSGQILKNRSGL
jgi:hypothetical protein